MTVGRLTTARTTVRRQAAREEPGCSLGRDLQPAHAESEPGELGRDEFLSGLLLAYRAGLGNQALEER